MVADLGSSGTIRRVRVRVIVPDVARPLRDWLDAERERWALWVPVAIGLGIALYFALPFEPRISHTLAALAVSLILTLLVRSGTLAVFLVGAMAWASTGFIAANVRSLVVAAPVLERPLTNVTVEAIVERMEVRPGRGGHRLTLAVIRIGDLAAEQRPVRIRVRIMRPLIGLAPGDAIRLTASLSPPARPILPGDYDFGRAAWFQYIGAVGYALKAPERLEPPPSRGLLPGFFAAVERVRQAITERITAALPGERGQIAAALITGERGGISDQTNEAYRASGIYHILSISGLHMVVMAGAVFWSVRLALATVPLLALRYPIRKWAAVAAAIAAFCYLLISAAQPATQRSFLMILIGFAAILADRPAIALRTVALTAIALLLMWPESLLDIGFQMSFAAVVAIVSAYEEIRRRQGEGDRDAGVVRRSVIGLGGIVATTLIAGAAVWPFGAYYFHTSQQYAVLGNVLAIPICNLVVMPAALATLVLMPFGLEGAALWIMGHGIDGMTVIAQWVGGLPGSTVPVRAMSDAGFHTMLAGGLWLTLWSTRWRLLGLGAIAVGLALAPFAPRPDIIVARDGRLVLVRGPDGQLAGLPARGAAFEARRILEHDGDGRPIDTVLAGTQFACDPLGCVARVTRPRIAVIRHPAAFVDDCRAADIVITVSRAPAWCTPKRALIDRRRLETEGTHIFRRAPDGQLALLTVQGYRGRRPWAGSIREPASLAASQAGQSPSRLRQFASRRAMTVDEGIEDNGSDRE
jgi:competence protein ComEC